MTLSLEELKLTGFLGQIWIKELCEMTIKILSPKMWMIWKTWCRDVRHLIEEAFRL